MSKPNVLLLMSDERPVFLTGAYGHRSVKTPTLDALADVRDVSDLVSFVAGDS